MEKKCSKCGEVKPINGFNRHKGRKDGYSTECRECSNRASNAYRKINKESLSLKQKKFYQENRQRIIDNHKKYMQSQEVKERQKKYMVVYSKKYAQENKEGIREYQRVYNKTEKGKSIKKISRCKYRLKYPETIKVRQTFEDAVKSGKFPRASTKMCSVCEIKQAQEWHHHKGYATENTFDVIPVCVPCHRKIERKYNHDGVPK